MFFGVKLTSRVLAVCLPAGGVFKIQKLQHPSVADEPLEVPERCVQQRRVRLDLPGG